LNLLPVLQTGTADLKSVWRTSTIAPLFKLHEARAADSKEGEAARPAYWTDSLRTKMRLG
jgi:hypothetical protein